MDEEWKVGDWFLTADRGMPFQIVKEGSNVFYICRLDSDDNLKLMKTYLRRLAQRRVSEEELIFYKLSQ